MQIHSIIHAPFETLGAIETWANKAGYPVSSSHIEKLNLFLNSIVKVFYNQF